MYSKELNIMSNLFIGIMSGTSLDGVDIALCEIDGAECRLIESHEYPFPSSLKEEVLGAISNAITLESLGTLDHKLGLLYANAVSEFLLCNGVRAEDINAIGLHGQTLWHAPDSATPFSMQLGDTNLLVAKTGIKTVSDFRRMDIANGGQGAPFAPAFHKFLFASLGEKVAVLNIGGMANLSILAKEVIGWDTGCGNVLLDYWMTKTQAKPYDKDGAFARSGQVHQELLNAMLSDEYFKKASPKSTGREYFNAIWIEKHLSLFNGVKAEDVQRTLLELTAQSIANDLQRHKIKTLIVCGGGAKNGFLMQRLSELCEYNVKSSDALGVRSDAFESMAFAWFAYKRVKREAVDLCSITGAKKPSQLGAIYG